MKIELLAHQGRANYANMASSIATTLFDFKKDYLKKSFQTMRKIEHRLEFVAKLHGITFWNDSKATNVNSAWYALESMKSPIVWIAGGVDNGNDYQSLIPLVKEKVHTLICIGVDNEKLIKTFSPFVDNVFESRSMDQAVYISYKIGNSGDSVLLSPACAGFDMFESIEDRGKRFKNAIREL
ncbi:MAG: hypothetical protein GX259_07425 [Bacteroidales bacterium]|jgi:UDP-N-acetylmuramoylalanine--D-glutamate ligase|nr:hypothetical protein [Bacteroidales bacterium]